MWLLQLVIQLQRNHHTINNYSFKSVLILHNQCHPPPAKLLDDAVKHTGKVDLRWQQLEVVGKPHTITQLGR